MVFASGSWPASGWTPGSTRRVVLKVDNIANNTAIGVFPYVLEVTIVTASGSVTSQATGQFGNVSFANNPFGAGWAVAGVERLDVSNGNRLFWFAGDGSFRVYNLRSGSVAPNRVWGAPSASYPDSIRESVGTYVRQLPDSVWVTFGSIGEHLTTRNSKGHVTTFGYDSFGRLSQIAVPPDPVATALKWVFNYDANSKLSSVTAPGDPTSRTVTFNVNATTGRLDSIADPGTPARKVKFGYIAGNLMTSRTNGRSVVTRFQYDSSYHVSRASLILPGDSISRAITNWQSFGVSGAAADTSLIRVALSGPRVGQLTTFRLDRFGAPKRVVSAVSATDSLVSTVSRLNATFPTLVTQSISPTNYAVDATYDTRGRLLTQSSFSTSGALATTQYTWDQKWDEVVVVKNPEGDSTAFGIDAVTGNRMWQQDARGSTSRINYTYTPTNQVLSMQYPLSAAQDFAYDAKGNLSDRWNELDMQWKWTNNTIGLTTISEAPFGDGTFGAVWAPRAVTNYSYSARNEVIKSWTSTGSKKDTVTTAYDAEGNALTIRRNWVPNPQAIAAQTDTMFYDNADRAVVKGYSTGGRDSTFFDAAGGATAVVNRRNRRVSMTYDLLGRMLTRDVPADVTYAYPTPNFTPSQGLELVPYGLTRPAESQAFTYHPSGQIATATALDANVVRTYHASGAMLTDTLKIRDSTRATMPHVFSLSYTYDRNGRRLSRILGPTSLFSGSPMTYAYNSWGALASITDIAGKTYSFAYNVIGELQTTTLPANITRALGYDGAGRLSSDVITNSNSSSTFPYNLQSAVRNFTITKRNARGQILAATDPTLIGGPIPSMTYDSAGFLVKSARSQGGYVLGSGSTPTFVANDTMAYDGLGNILSKQGSWSLLPNYAAYLTTNTYNTAGRLSIQNDTRSGSGGSSSRYSTYAYDASGNTRFEVNKPNSGATSNSGERASYYAADDRLIGTDVRSTGKRMLEEYRYDALGRRVWVSKDQGCAPTSDLSCVTDGPTRTMWDGSDEVAEIKAPLGVSNGAELNAGFPLIPWSPVGDPNPFYGRVVYAPGLTVDQPLSVTRYDYRDNPSGGTSATWPTFTLMPFWDYRGTPVYGVTTDGATAIPLTPGGTSCPNPGVATATRCVLLSWNFAADAYRQESGNLLTLSWHGTVLQNKKDGSGLQYMRNRVYDPGTGRFTQEDPIGLAGGLNAYGFAGGDPVNSSDPFGLKPCPPDNDCDTGLIAAFTITGATIGGFGGGAAGTSLGATCGPAAIVCSTAAGGALSLKGAAIGGAAGAALGVLFSKGQAAAIKTAESLVGHISRHIGMLRGDPNGRDANGWREEVKAGIDRVERQIEHMGKRTAEKWAQQVKEWRNAIPQ